MSPSTPNRSFPYLTACVASALALASANSVVVWAQESNADILAPLLDDDDDLLAPLREQEESASNEASTSPAASTPASTPDPARPAEAEPTAADKAPSETPVTSPEVEPVAPLDARAVAAQERLGSLLSQVASLAQQVSAKSEELKESQDDFDKQEKELAKAEKHATKVAREAKNAQKMLAEQQKAIDGLANSRYRGGKQSALITTLSSGNPQEATERLGYMGALSREAHRNLTALERTAAKSETTKREADKLAQLARAKRDELEKKKQELEKQQADLMAKQAVIEGQVDSLDSTQRALWVGQFGGGRKIDAAELARLSLTGVGGAAARAALTRQGAPYVWGATGPASFDCSGLMYWAYKQQGKTIPRTSQAQLAGGTPVPFDKLQPGDLVGYYAGFTHVGMYIGNGQVVHAPTYGVPVQVVPLYSMPALGAVRF